MPPLALKTAGLGVQGARFRGYLGFRARPNKSMEKPATLNRGSMVLSQTPDLFWGSG